MPLGITNFDKIQSYRKARGRPMQQAAPSYSFNANSPNANSPNATQYPQTGGGMGSLDYDPNQYADYNSANLPNSSNPEQSYANIILEQQAGYMRDYAPFEEALIASLEDQSLVEAVPEDVEREIQKSKEIAERNRQRYGVTQTAVEQRESGRALQREEQLQLAGGLTNARVAQEEMNYQTLAGLINIGAGVYQSNLQTLGSAAQNEVSRKAAYDQAQASYKSNLYGAIGSLGSTAILMAFGI